jgi:hypothetical protein
MPVTTTVYIYDPVDHKRVFAKCAELTGAPAGAAPSDDGGMMFTDRDQGNRAWTWVEYGQDGSPLRTAAAPHTAHCAPVCGYQHAPACWIEAVFDTDDSYQDDHGGPEALHQQLVTRLGQWLDAQGIRWSWRNHGDGIIHDGTERRVRLFKTGGGAR